MKENENSAGYTYLAVSRPPATVELLRRSGKDRGEEGTQGKENQISFDQELKRGGEGPGRPPSFMPRFQSAMLASPVAAPLGVSL
jgi:hypothetical protein